MTKRRPRHERRAEARAAAKAKSPGRVDPALMQVLVKAKAQLDDAKRSAAEAQGTINLIGKQIRESHNLSDEDRVDLATGVITRAPRAKRNA